MKVPCDIIRDILPLYAENMVSDATKEMVDNHMHECRNCGEELASLKRSTVPVDIDTRSLKRVEDAIRRRRIFAIMAVVLFITTLGLGIALMLDATIYLSASEAVKEITVEGNEAKIVWDDRVIGTSGCVKSEDPGNYSVTAWTNLYRLLVPVDRVPYESLDEEVKNLISQEQYLSFNTSSYALEDQTGKVNFWYVDPSENSYQLLHNGGAAFPSGTIMDVYINGAYYIAVLVSVCIVCVFLGQIFKGKWFGELAIRFAIILGCLAISAVIVHAGEFASINGDLRETIVDSSAVALPMSLFGLFLRQILKFNRQDKCM